MEREIHEIGPWRIWHDAGLTKKTYVQVAVGSAERCGCTECANFAVARERAFPKKALQLFEKLGIDYKKEAEVYYKAPLEPGLHLYGGWFNFVGGVEQGEEDLYQVAAGCQLEITSDPALIPSVFANQPVVQIEFNVQVPWVVELREPIAAAAGSSI